MTIEEKLLNDFEINAELLPVLNDQQQQFNAFRQLLIQRIEELAERNMEHLMWLLYRVDVSEQKLKEALQNHPPASFASVMADAIIQRETEKAESRKKFSKGGGEWQFDET